MTMKLAVVTLTILDDDDLTPLDTVSRVIGLPTRFAEVHFQADVVQDANFSNLQVLNIGIYTDDRADYYEGNKP